MKQQQLEALVIASIDRARAGNPIEDDRIEFKREWPDPTKARQLAGFANRANGNYVVYIVGASESGAVFALDATDPADWWAKLSSKFDGVAPDLMHHINVPTGAGESVAALLFGTDRAPYVVNAGGGGSPEREVPMRDGTRTRSARRDELLRMLVPQSSVPPALLLGSSFTAEWYPEASAREEFPNQDARPAFCSLSGTALIFLEHTAASGVMLPFHAMEASLETRDRAIPLKVRLSPQKQGESPPDFGVHARRDGVIATGPGQFPIGLSANDLGSEERDFLEGVENWTVRMKFGVIGAPRSVQVDGALSRDREFVPFQGAMQVQLARWKLSPIRIVTP
ncbi:helix-turn-helix domain-containing protein [Cryobacterium sp. Y62]|uniref:AlbA family DNA-binding domain-containing protein n=1 Tax=Cryobacterium sp. Y62 TaxID=2048284 RepID=UPI000CE3ECAF|nr:hypothetical protein [Cryobacterium sp. Y62]